VRRGRIEVKGRMRGLCWCMGRSYVELMRWVVSKCRGSKRKEFCMYSRKSTVKMQLTTYTAISLFAVSGFPNVQSHNRPGCDML